MITFQQLLLLLPKWVSLTVAASGNDGDKPYVTGTPTVARTALSIAWTDCPNICPYFIEVMDPESSEGSYPAIHQIWSAPATK
jgi:hypothetical protein